MKTVSLHPKLLLVYSEKSDGNLDDRFSSPKEVRANRQQFLSPVNLNFRDTIEAAQIHSNRILLINSENAKMWRGVNVTGVDGFITVEITALLMVKTADCVPIVMYDPDHHAVGLFHAGWRGLVSGIATLGLSRLVSSYQSNPAHILVWFGPAARACHFVTKDIPDQIDEEVWKPYIKKSGGQYAVDMIGYLKDTLHQSGILKSHMTDSGLCTVETPGLFSHQRSVVSGEPEGRLGVVVKLK